MILNNELVECVIRMCITFHEQTFALGILEEKEEKKKKKKKIPIDYIKVARVF